MNFELNNERQFNNPDSFAMAFDDAWKIISQKDSINELDKGAKIKAVLEKIKDHPYLLKNKAKAKQIAIFRIKLLGLN